MRKYLVLAATLGMLVAVPITAANAVTKDADGVSTLTAQQVADYKEAQDAAGLGPGIIGPRDPVEMAEEARLVRQKDAELAAGTLEWFKSGPGKAHRDVAPVSTNAPKRQLMQFENNWCGSSAFFFVLRSATNILGGPGYI